MIIKVDIGVDCIIDVCETPNENGAYSLIIYSDDYFGGEDGISCCVIDSDAFCELTEKANGINDEQDEDVLEEFEEYINDFLSNMCEYKGSGYDSALEISQAILSDAAVCEFVKKNIHQTKLEGKFTDALNDLVEELGCMENNVIPYRSIEESRKHYEKKCDEMITISNALKKVWY